MFILVKKQATASLGNQNGSIAKVTGRTPNACDMCRIRKAKCDGQTPCAGCTARNLVCTSSHARSEASGPLSKEHIASLQKQQKRLARALTAMSAVIQDAESQGFVSRQIPPDGQHASSVKVLELLNKYAPDDPTIAFDAERRPLPTTKQSELHKKRKFEQPVKGLPDRRENACLADEIRDQSLPLSLESDVQQPLHRFLAAVQHQDKIGAISNDALMASLDQISSLSTCPLQGDRDQSTVLETTVDMQRRQPLSLSDPISNMIDWDTSLAWFLDDGANAIGHDSEISGSSAGNDDAIDA